MALPAAIHPLPFPVLIGDIGGTNARFGLLAAPDAAIRKFPSVATADFPDVEKAIESVLAHSDLRPRSAILDLAGPVAGDAVSLTNVDWVIRPAEALPRLGLQDMILLNDFEAQALSLTALEPADLTPLGAVADGGAGAKVVLGPGTGLGVGALIEAGGLWTPVPGEGGHVAFGPAEADEFPVWAAMEPEHGRISAEAILCGRGLLRLYKAVAAADGAVADAGGPAEITQAALAGSDPLAVKTLSLWSRLLGRLAGDLALTFMARGGVYVGGGIPPRILPFLLEGEFRRAFEAKAPHQGVMAGIPTFVITGDSPALAGLAAFARAPERFGVALAGRRWRS